MYCIPNVAFRQRKNFKELKKSESLEICLTKRNSLETA